MSELSLQESVLDIIRDESGVEPVLHETLATIFDGDVRAYSNTITRLELLFGVQMCSLKRIDWLRGKTVEFVLWCLEQPLKKTEETIIRIPTEAYKEQRSLIIATAQVAQSTVHSVLLSEEDPLWENPEICKKRQLAFMEMFNNGFVDVWLFLKKSLIEKREKAAKAATETEPWVPKLYING